MLGERVSNGSGDDLWAIEPVYARRSAAEEKAASVAGGAKS
jgi:hypothetical protein